LRDAGGAHCRDPAALGGRVSAGWRDGRWAEGPMARWLAKDAWLGAAARRRAARRRWRERQRVRVRRRTHSRCYL
jgi:hypothetical protein